MQVIRVSLYLIAFVVANFIVLWYGQTGLIFTALLLIPFDFVLRCVFHETWKGKELVAKLGALVIAASTITFAINSDTLMIAIGSSVGFMTAQIAAGITYQVLINRRYILKVNGSDLAGIIFDSISFQYIAFGNINLKITCGQVGLKMIGGLLWYYILFEKLKIQNKLK